MKHCDICYWVDKVPEYVTAVAKVNFRGHYLKLNVCQTHKDITSKLETPEELEKYIYG